MKLRIAQFAVLVIAVSLVSPAHAQLWNRPVLYGGDLLTMQERRGYRADIKALETDEEKLARWEQHVELIQRLALERGVSIKPAPHGLKRREDRRIFGHAPYFRELMTLEEREAYRDKIWYIHDDMERKIYVSAHILKIQARARARGVSAPRLDKYEREAIEAIGATAASDTGTVTPAEPPDSGDAGSSHQDREADEDVAENTAGDVATD